MSRASTLLIRGSLLGPLLLTAWLLASFPTLLVGTFHPVLALALFVPVAGVLLAASLPVVPVRPVPSWAAWSTFAVATGFALLAGLTHAEHVVLRRDDGSYAQFAYWIAQHGELPVPGYLAAFGGDDPALTIGSPAFYERGDSLVPQFMAGTPLTLAAGYWLGGWSLTHVLPAVAGGLAVLAMGGLTARLVGPRWAPLGALALALTQPLLYTSRTTFSEPFALLLLLGGVCLLVDMLGSSTGDAAGIRVGFAAGLVLGLSTLVRIDAARELTLLVPALGWLFLVTRRRAFALGAGLLVGLAYGTVDGAVLTRPYVDHLKGSLLPLAALFIVLLAGTVLAVLAVLAVAMLARPSRSLTAARWWRPVPALGAVLVALTGVLLAARPVFGEVHQDSPETLRRNIVGLQRSQGLPIDGDRTYAEESLHWVSWYVGWGLLALALVAAVVLTWRVLGDRDRRWLPVLVMLLGGTVLTLWRPGITPDHPWADRRLVPVVLPAVILLAVWAAAAGLRALRRLLVGRGWPVRRREAAVPVVGAAAVAVLTVPALVATVPMLGARTHRGQVEAVGEACRAFQPGEVALLVDSRAANEWPQVLRGMCGVPAAAVRTLEPDPDSATVRRLVEAARAAGSRPVLVAAEGPDTLTGLGVSPVRVVSLRTQQPQRVLTERPSRTVGLTVSLWLARPEVQRGAVAGILTLP